MGEEGGRRVRGRWVGFEVWGMGEGTQGDGKGRWEEEEEEGTGITGCR